MTKNEETKNRILLSAKEEFSEKGFLNASMRTIAEKAGVTTGALYHCFKDKSEMFDCLVKDAADELYDYFSSSQSEFACFSDEEQVERLHSYADGKKNEMVNIIYRHFDCFRLIITKSVGSEYEHYPDRLIEVETENTKRFLKIIERKKIGNFSVGDDFIHILSSALFNGFFEPVAHDMDRAAAERYIEDLFAFFNAGWERILGL